MSLAQLLPQDAGALLLEVHAPKAQCPSLPVRDAAHRHYQRKVIDHAPSTRPIVDQHRSSPINPGVHRHTRLSDNSVQRDGRLGLES